MLAAPQPEGKTMTRNQMTSRALPLALDVEYPSADVAVVHIGGELDILTTPHVARLMESPLAGDAEVIVMDLSGVTFMASAALALLVEIRRRTQDRGMTLRLVTGPRCVERSLQLNGLMDGGVFATFPTVSAAVSAPVG